MPLLAAHAKGVMSQKEYVAFFEIIIETIMAFVMIVVEIISALIAPAAEVAAPVFVFFGEVLFWVVLLVVELFIALIRWRRPTIPSKPRFSGIRRKLKRFSISWRNKRDKNKSHNEKS